MSEDLRMTAGLNLSAEQRAARMAELYASLATKAERDVAQPPPAPVAKPAGELKAVGKWALGGAVIAGLVGGPAAMIAGAIAGVVLSVMPSDRTDRGDYDPL